MSLSPVQTINRKVKQKEKQKDHRITTLKSYKKGPWLLINAWLLKRRDPGIQQ